MIVRHESDGSLVMISQNDHAKAAGYMASHWGNSRFEKPTPLANLHLTLLNKVGVPLDSFADSQGQIDELFEPLPI